MLEGLEIRFTDVGHLLGSAAIELWLREGDTERKVVFSGDVGNTNQPLLRDPQRVESADVLIIESTYGDRLHEKVRLDYPRALAEVLQRTLDRGGNVVIPSFAVGRTQEMLYFLRQIKLENLVHGHGDFPVYVDSPLANEATAVFLQANPASLDDEARALIRAGVNPLWFDGLKTSVTANTRSSVNFDQTPKVILSASGMCDAGRIRHHLKHNLWRKESTILFVGYQAEGTLGRQIVEGAKKVKLFGEDISVAAEVRVLPGVSGHADRDGLLAWLEGFAEKPGRVFVKPRRRRLLHLLCGNAQAPRTQRLRPLQRRDLRHRRRRNSRLAEGVPAQKAKARARATSLPACSPPSSASCASPAAARAWPTRNLPSSPTRWTASPTSGSGRGEQKRLRAGALFVALLGNLCRNTGREML